MKKYVLPVLVCLAALQPAQALDPGEVRGTFTVAGTAIPLRFAHAHLHDNAEGVLPYLRELRILLADRDVPFSSLAGVSLRDLEWRASGKKLRGVLLTLDPSKPRAATATLLMPPTDAEGKFRTFKLALTNWRFHPQRVLGNLKYNAGGKSGQSVVSWSLRFSAPVFNEPKVTADVKGKAALDSAPVRSLAKLAEALDREDRPAVEQLTTAAAQLDLLMVADHATGPVGVGKGSAPVYRAAAKEVRRVVVRGNSATLIFPRRNGYHYTMRREGGSWKLDGGFLSPVDDRK